MNRTYAHRACRTGPCLLTVAIAACLAAPAAAKSDPKNLGPACATELISRNIRGATATGRHLLQAISDDGTVVAFTSDSAEWDGVGQPFVDQVVVYDANTDTFEVVSVSTGGQRANQSNYDVAISGDGRYVSFLSFANNLHPLDQSTDSDIYLHDRQTGTTELITVNFSGTGNGNGFSEYSSVSDDGRFVLFSSDSSNLDPAFGLGFIGQNVFLRDRQLGTTSLVSLDRFGNPDGGAFSRIDISGDGTHAAYTSFNSEVVADDFNFNADVFVVDLTTGNVERVSVQSDGTENTSNADYPLLSDDGRFVAFHTAGVLDPSVSSCGEFFFCFSVYVHDRLNSTTTQVSRGLAGAAPNDYSYARSISDDGRYVAFETYATNIVTDDFNFRNDFFVFDQFLQSTSRVSLGTGGIEGNSDAFVGVLSGDGTTFAFGSRASNLVPNDINNTTDIFRRDLAGDVTTLVTRSSPRSTGNGPSAFADISDDGRFVVFESRATDIVDNEVIGSIASDSRVVLHDRDLDVTTRVSLFGSFGSDVTGYNPSIAGNGRTVAFDTNSGLTFGNSIDTDLNGTSDVYVRDLDLDTTTRVSISTLGFDTDGPSRLADVSANGRYIAFESDATNIVHNDRNNTTDVFVRDMWSMDVEHIGEGDDPAISGDGMTVAYVSTFGSVLIRDRAADVTEFVPGVSGGAPAGFAPSVSQDGRHVAFDSGSSSFVAQDTNSLFDVFVYDRVTQHVRLVSRSSAGTPGDGHSYNASMSGDGRFVAFESESTNLLDGQPDTNGRADIYVHDLMTGQTTLASADAMHQTGNNDSYLPAINHDGSVVAFTSFATNLVDDDFNGYSDVFVRDRACEITTQACPGDVNTTGTTNGTPDGEVNLSDLQYYLGIWQTGLGINPGDPADINTTGTTNGLPDGEVNLSDLQYYLGLWQTGRGVCP